MLYQELWESATIQLYVLDERNKTIYPSKHLHLTSLNGYSLVTKVGTRTPFNIDPLTIKLQPLNIKRKITIVY